MHSLLAVVIPYWGQSLLRVLGGLVAVLLPAGTIVYVFLFKMMSFMQSRLGPMEAGPYGSMQLFADDQPAIKIPRTEIDETASA